MKALARWWRSLAWKLSSDSTGKWREPYGLWQLVDMVMREGPRPRTFARWWARWRGDVMVKREWARIKAMPEGAERDEAWRQAAVRALVAAKSNIEGALERQIR